MGFFDSLKSLFGGKKEEKAPEAEQVVEETVVEETTIEEPVSEPVQTPEEEKRD